MKVDLRAFLFIGNAISSYKSVSYKDAVKKCERSEYANTDEIVAFINYIC